MLVFMGGTCNESKWREKLIEYSNNMNYKFIDWSNPVVDDWTPECIQKEYEMKKKSDFEIYVITPKMTGVFSIAEAVDVSNKNPDKIIFCVLENDEEKVFENFQLKSLNEVSNLIESNGGKVVKSLEEIADYINEKSFTYKFIPK